MKRAAAGLALLAGFSACSKPVDVRHVVTVENVNLGQGGKVEAYADGQLTPSAMTPRDGGRGPRITFEAHGTLKGETHLLPELKVKVLLGCGWRDLPLRVSESWPVDEVRERAREGEPVTYTAGMPTLPGQLAALWVDNRGGKAGELGLGPLRIPVPAGEAARMDVDTCDAAIAVKFNGTPIGEIPATSSTTADIPTILIDPSGSRCYRQYRVWYAAESQGGGAKSRPVPLAGRKVYYSAEFIAYVFETPPLERLTFNGENPSYGVIEDAKCR